MKIKERLSLVCTYLAIGWLFANLLYFHYVMYAAWFGKHANVYQGLSLIYGYISLFYFAMAAFVLMVFNHWLLAKSKVFYALQQKWWLIDTMLKVAVFPLTIVALIYMSPGQLHA